MAYKIETPADWWKVLEDHWNDIQQCFALCGAPMTLEEEGYWWADSFGGEVIRHDKSLIRTLEDARKYHDNEMMARLLNACWIAAPDSRKIHGWPSWHVLCDLCSEEWVFEPEEMVADAQEN